jgi:hypothetical protein
MGLSTTAARFGLQQYSRFFQIEGLICNLMLFLYVFYAKQVDLRIIYLKNKRKKRGVRAKFGDKTKR